MVKYKNKKFKLHKTHTLFLFLTLCIGIIIGILMSKSMPKNNYDTLLSLFENYFNLISNSYSEFLPLFIKGSFKYFKVIFIIWFLCAFPIGSIIIFLFILAKGISYGYITNFLIMFYGISGIFIAIILYLPQILIVLPTYFFIDYKCTYFRIYNFSCNKNKKIIFFKYLKYLLIGALFCCLASIFEIIFLKFLINLV